MNITHRLPKKVYLSFPSRMGDASGIDYNVLRSFFTGIPGGIEQLIEDAVRNHFPFNNLAGFMDIAVTRYRPVLDTVVYMLPNGHKVADEMYRIFRRQVIELWRYMSHVFSEFGQNQHLYHYSGKHKSRFGQTVYEFEMPL